MDDRTLPPRTLTLDDLAGIEGYHYLATPYSRYPGGIERAHKSACMLTGALMRLTIPVYSPIAHSHPIAMTAKIDPCSHDFWLPVCGPMMRAAHGIIVAEFPGWDQSVGMKHEIDWFVAAGKPVVNLSLDMIYSLCPEWMP